MRYEVQHFTLCDGWINCWTVDDHPQTFASRSEAQAELNELFDDITQQIKDGDRAPDEGYDRDEFRIVPLPAPETITAMRDALEDAEDVQRFHVTPGQNDAGYYMDVLEKLENVLILVKGGT